MDTGNVSAQNSTFIDSILTNTVYLTDSIKRNAIPVSDAYPDGDGGYEQSNSRVVVNLGTLNPGGQISVTFEVRVNSGFSGTISNQGIGSGGNFSDILTDDLLSQLRRGLPALDVLSPSKPLFNFFEIFRTILFTHLR